MDDGLLAIMQVVQAVGYIQEHWNSAGHLEPSLLVALAEVYVKELGDDHWGNGGLCQGAHA